jgi:hypothetical protein
LADKENAETYGVELDESRGNEAQTRLDRVGFGSYFHASISHDAFHLMLLNPPYLSVMDERGRHTRHEKRFLSDSYYRLLFGGILIYIIPYYRLTADICRMLCDNFKDLRVFRFSDAEFKKFKQVAVIGVRQKRIDGADQVDELLAQASNPDAIPTLDTIPDGLYALPTVEKRVDCFKGARFNLRELAEQLKQSRSLNLLFQKSKLDSMEKKPLLPLNISQIGLVGGSGLINGLVNCETPHIIKGRIIKETKTETYAERDEKGRVTGGAIKEQRVNKMIFNVLTPDGFRSLA